MAVNTWNAISVHEWRALPDIAELLGITESDAQQQLARLMRQKRAECELAERQGRASTWYRRLPE